MSDTGLQVGATTLPPTRGRGHRLRRPLVLVLLALVLFSLVRILSGANDLTSAGSLGAAVGLAVPIGMAGLGGLWAERSGVVNIGLEGMMILGTWGAGWAGYQWGPWAGVAMAVACGTIGGLVHALLTVTFGVDHIISGVAINILGLGTTQYLADTTFVTAPGGSSTQSPSVGDLPVLSVPGMSSALSGLVDRQWFLLSDAASAVLAITVNVSVLTVIAVGLLVLTYVVLWRTSFGLRLRFCGENPTAAASLGINVYRFKYAAVAMSGSLSGFGGAFLALVAANAYREGQTGGRGFIGLAAMIFGNWRPGGLAFAAGLFGYTDALQLRRGGETVHALLLLVALLLVGFAVYELTRRRTRVAILSLAAAAGFLVWFLGTDTVPDDFANLTPYVTTLLVLALASQRLRMPAADGQVYRRGQNG